MAPLWVRVVLTIAIGECGRVVGVIARGRGLLASASDIEETAVLASTVLGAGLVATLAHPRATTSLSLALGVAPAALAGLLALHAKSSGLGLFLALIAIGTFANVHAEAQRTRTTYPGQRMPSRVLESALFSLASGVGSLLAGGATWLGLDVPLSLLARRTSDGEVTQGVVTALSLLTAHEVGRRFAPRASP